MTDTCCAVTDRAFSESEARHEVRAYRTRGPAGQTRMLLEALRSLGLKDMTLLDIGGGIGVIHHELLQDMARSAVQVDASSAYLKEARAEANRRGHADRVTFVHADFTEVATNMAPADIVTLDRVVCCYPDANKLLTGAAERSRRVLAMTYPRETWYMRLGLGIVNTIQRLRKESFRTFLHPPAEMEQLLRGLGFQRSFFRQLFVWEIAVYLRV
jgi:2-polyprenyl-3-methyl-5-hydroxy-6-metoxy-1,4-benzoquinol methylase